MENPLSSITWNASQADLNVTYSFFTEGVTVENDGESFTSTSIDPFVMGQIVSVFETISQYTSLTFTAATDDTDFRIMLSTDFEEETDGFMNPPGETNAGLGIFKAAPNSLFETGAYNYSVVIHEVLHGLGLAHPHDDGGGSDIMNGVTEDFDDYGDFDLNQGVYTVMTYNDGFPLGVPAPDSKEYGFPTGPMALDVAALQAKYGANATWASSDNAYEIVGTNAVGTGWTTIWDTAGSDRIFYDGSSNATIDLRPATLEYEVGGGGFVSSVEGIAGGYTIANGVTIENATGGSGDDMITGNALANMLMGNDGADMLFGGAGNDMLDGGNSMDTAMFSGGQNSYTLQFSKTGTTITDRRASEDGTDTLVSIENLQFADESFDIGIRSGAVGLTQDEYELISDLYIAYFDRAPAAKGLLYWATELENGMSIPEIAKSFFVQPETQSQYASLLNEDGSLINTQAFVTAVFQNVLGREPTSQYWVNELDNNPDITPAIFILAVLNGARAVTGGAQDVAYLEAKTDIGVYFSAIKGLSDHDDAVAVMNIFDGSESSVTAAVSEIDRLHTEALDPTDGGFLIELVGVVDNPFDMTMAA